MIDRKDLSSILDGVSEVFKERFGPIEVRLSALENDGIPARHTRSSTVTQRRPDGSRRFTREELDVLSHAEAVARSNCYKVYRRLEARFNQLDMENRALVRRILVLETKR